MASVDSPRILDQVIAQSHCGGSGGNSHLARGEFGGAGAEPKPQQAPSGAPQFVLKFARSRKPGNPGRPESAGGGGRGGVAIPSACRQGQCGTCKTRLIEGDVWMSAENGLDPESKARGYILTCVGHASANVKLDA